MNSIFNLRVVVLSTIISGYFCVSGFGRIQNSPEFVSEPAIPGVYGKAYEHIVRTNAAGTEKLEIILFSGAPPAGITFQDNGDRTAQFSGVPEETGTFQVELMVREAEDHSSNDIQAFDLDIDKAKATITLANLTVPYTGSPTAVTAVTDPEGLQVEVTYNGSPDPPVEIGDYNVSAVVNEMNYEGGAEGILSIIKTEATVQLSNLTQTYTGSPLSPNATTDPAGLRVDFTYNGFSDAPVNAGSYDLVATINDPAYEGSATGTFLITKAEATIQLDQMSKRYTGTPQTPLITTTPAELDYTVTYNGSSEPPTAVGTYAVVVDITDPNYQGSANGNFVISNNEATVTLSGLTTAYNGSPQTPIATTDPPGLAVEFTFDGAPAPPVNAGTYQVTATINDAEYSGSTSGTFLINKAVAAVKLSDMTKSYTGSAQSPTITTDPAGLSVMVTYNGSAELPVAKGNYTIEAVVDDPNYQGSASGTFIIGNGEATVTLSDLTTTYNGSPQSVSVTTQPEGLPVNVTYNGLLTLPTDAGEYEVVATIDDPEYTGSASGTFLINPAIAKITISNLYQNYDGTPKPVAVNTVPDGLETIITYDGAAAVPSALGSYQVEVALSSSNYTGSQSGTLIINGPPTASEIPSVSVNEDAANFYINLEQYFNDTEEGAMSFSIQDNTNATIFTGLEINDSRILVLDFAPDLHGAAEVTVRATDMGGLFVDNTFAVTVTGVQDDPVFTSTPVEGALQGEQYIYNPQATDPDIGDKLTYTKIFIPDWLSFTANATGGGELTGIPGTNDIGSHPVTLEVSDDKGNTATQSFTLKVAQSNVPPSFTSTPVLEVDQDQFYRYTIVTDDANDNPVTITAPDLPEWLTLTDHGDGTATLDGTAGNEFTGASRVVLRVTDIFEAYEEQAFTITVHNTNDAPNFVSEPLTVASLNEKYSYEIATDDIDADDSHTISATARPAWLSLMDNGDGTAILSGNPPADASGMAYSVSLVVKDRKGASSSQRFIITVNTPPEIADITMLINEDSPRNFKAGDFELGFTDDDGNGIVLIRIESLPATGELTWRNEQVMAGTNFTVTIEELQELQYAPPLNESGSATFTWTAFDGYDWATTNAAVDIEIVPVNDPPILTNIEETPLTYSQKDPGVPVTETIIINDVDNSYIQGASIAIQDGYNSNKDLLSYDNPDNENITAAFDKANGVLTLTGEDSRSNYEMALSNVAFSSKVSGQTDIVEKSIRITVTDGLNASDPVFRRVRIADLLPELNIVNAFTPNNDRVNDLWDFVNLEFYSAINITVFDQRGTRVFSCSENDCTWDGTSNGKALAAGPYFYTIELNNGKKKYQGTVVILK